MKVLPRTIEGCHMEIKKLRKARERDKIQMEADSEAMQMMCKKTEEALTGRDAYVMERCKKCRERMRGL